MGISGASKRGVIPRGVTDLRRERNHSPRPLPGEGNGRYTTSIVNRATRQGRGWGSGRRRLLALHTLINTCSSSSSDSEEDNGASADVSPAGMGEVRAGRRMQNELEG